MLYHELKFLGKNQEVSGGVAAVRYFRGKKKEKPAIGKKQPLQNLLRKEFSNRAYRTKTKARTFPKRPVQKEYSVTNSLSD